MSANGTCSHCHRDDEMVAVVIPAELSHTQKTRLHVVGVDACIAGIVRRLNAGATEPVTRGCCCGHGRGPGSIALQDGRELTLLTVPEVRVVLSDQAPPEACSHCGNDGQNDRDGGWPWTRLDNAGECRQCGRASSLEGERG